MAVTSFATLMTAAAAGFGLGFAHGLETDHLTEIASQVIRRGGDWFRSLLIGAAFGIGHIVTILILGGLGLGLGITVTDRFANFVDGVAGLLIIWLGSSTLFLAIHPFLKSQSNNTLLNKLTGFIQMLRQGGLHFHYERGRGWYLHQHAGLSYWERDPFQQELLLQSRSGRRLTWKEQVRRMRQQMLLGGIFALNPPPEAIAIFMMMIPAKSHSHSFGIGGWWNGFAVILFFGLGITVSMGLWGMLVSGVFNFSQSRSLYLARVAAGTVGVMVIVLGVVFSFRAFGFAIIPNLDDSLHLSKGLQQVLRVP